MTQGLPGRVLGALVAWTLPTPECFSPEPTSPPPQHRIKPSVSSSALGCSLHTGLGNGGRLFSP